MFPNTKYGPRRKVPVTGIELRTLRFWVRDISDWTIQHGQTKLPTTCRCKSGIWADSRILDGFSLHRHNYWRGAELRLQDAEFTFASKEVAFFCTNCCYERMYPWSTWYIRIGAPGFFSFGKFFLRLSSKTMMMGLLSVSTVDFQAFNLIEFHKLLNVKPPNVLRTLVTMATTVRSLFWVASMSLLSFRCRPFNPLGQFLKRLGVNPIRA